MTAPRTEGVVAPLLDRLMVCVEPTIEPVLQMELAFADRLDRSRLARAVERLPEIDPILGARFVDDPRTPRWAPSDACARLELVARAEDYARARARSIDLTRGPPFSVHLLREPDRDRLLVRAHHVATDAAGTKAIVRALARLYRDPDRTAPLVGSRGMRQVLARIPWHARPPALARFARETLRLSFPSRTHSLPIDRAPRTSPSIHLRHLSSDHVAAIAARAKRSGGTLNDAVQTGCVRALVEVGGWDGARPLRLASTVDLRRYLPAPPERPCNLSTIEHVFLFRDPGRDSDATLARIVTQNRARKAGWIGLGSWLALGPILAPLPFARLHALVGALVERGIASGNTPPGLTDLGAIDPADVTFDSPPMTAWIVVPPSAPPLLTCGVSGHAGTLTISAGVYPEALTRASIDAFLDRFVARLPV